VHVHKDFGFVLFDDQPLTPHSLLKNLNAVIDGHAERRR
jgi:hypothetical protein